MSRGPLRARVSSCLCLLLAGSSLAAGAPSWADARLRLVHVQGRAAIERGGGTEPLTLPAGAEVERVDELGGGWIASGRRVLDDRLELFLLADQGRGAAEIAPPGDPTGISREGARAIVAGGKLLGLAWLEGDSRTTYAVRWAAWDGRAFGKPVDVSPRGPGSQLALGAAVLADGRIVLVWSGFDGLDDEVWASLGAPGRSWSKPERVGADNAVPDVTPDVTAFRDGALVAWSRYDGAEYRVRLARLAGDRFVELDAQGPGGSLYATFEGTDPHPRLLWRDARTDEWALAELADDRQLVTRARAQGAIDDRPQIRFEGDRVRFRFAGGEAVNDWR